MNPWLIVPLLCLDTASVLSIVQALFTCSAHLFFHLTHVKNSNRNGCHQHTIDCKSPYPTILCMIKSIRSKIEFCGTPNHRKSPPGTTSGTYFPAKPNGMECTLFSILKCGQITVLELSPSVLEISPSMDGDNIFFLPPPLSQSKILWYDHTIISELTWDTKCLMLILIFHSSLPSSLESHILKPPKY